jgi:2-polyprenyl-3-methyl-5-hydroxy-6-metoxy-1,4-benzoquinol methylase
MRASLLQRIRRLFPALSRLPAGEALLTRVKAATTYDRVSLHPAGLIVIEGWSLLPGDEPPAPRCELGGVTLALKQRYRSYRADVSTAAASAPAFAGVAWVYRVGSPPQHTEHRLRLSWSDGDAFETTLAQRFVVPDYAHLLDTDRVLHREQIYGSGPPLPEVSQEVLALAADLPAPLLDFGCGAGALVAALRARDCEASGIEIDRPEIRETLRSDARPHVQLYDGRFPLPFADGSFRSVTAVEVIEHIPDPGRVIAEIARVSADRALITVPDIEAIPHLHHAGVVPWHLLESTHLNFFTQRSLGKLLAPHFAHVEFMRLTPGLTNGLRWHVSLAALCFKQAPDRAGQNP